MMAEGPNGTDCGAKGTAVPSAPHLRHAACSIFLCLLAVIAWSSPLLARDGVGTERPDKVSFIPQWVPQAQFAGYYVAYEKGFYERHGLDVTILPGGPDYPPSTLLRKRQADFGSMFLATALRQRAKGLPVVNIAQIVQRSALMLVAKKSSGIRTPEDLDGRRVGLWGSEFRMQAMGFFRKYGVKVKAVPQRHSITLFLWDGVDATSAMWYNEYHTILNSGVDPEELVTFFLRDYGFDFPEDGLYCLEETFLESPQRACAFAAGSLEGWQYAFAHPEETLDIVMRYIGRARIPNSRVHQRWMLHRMEDIITPAEGGTPPGVLRPAVYEHVAHALIEGGLIDEAPVLEQFYRTCDAAQEN